MAVDWSDPQDVSQFRAYAVSKGKDPDVVEQYISQNVTRATGEAGGEVGRPVIPGEKRNIRPESVMKSAPVSREKSQRAEKKPQQGPVAPQTITNEDVGFSRSQGLPKVTQPYGKFNPQLEKYSGGVNLGTDFRAQQGTPLRAPKKGTWVVEQAQPGFNKGSGNIVRIKNPETGESIAYEHLSRVGVKPGQRVKPGQAVGLSGATGNVTGPHASIPYKTPQGQYRDIRQTPYVQDIFER